MQEEIRQDEQQENQNSDDRMIDKVGDTNIHPVSAMDEASDDAEVMPPGKLGDSDNDDNS